MTKHIVILFTLAFISISSFAYTIDYSYLNGTYQGSIVWESFDHDFDSNYKSEQCSISSFDLNITETNLKISWDLKCTNTNGWYGGIHKNSETYERKGQLLFKDGKKVGEFDVYHIKVKASIPEDDTYFKFHILFNGSVSSKLMGFNLTVIEDEDVDIFRGGLLKQ